MDRFPRTVILAVACALAGWLAGRALRSPISLPRDVRTPLALPMSANEPEQASLPKAAQVASLSDEKLATLIEASLRAEGRANQMHALYAVASEFQSMDFPRALAVLSAINTDDARALRNSLAAFWLESDLPAARAWLSALPAAERANIFPELVDTWARLDPVDLRDWLRSFPPEESADLTTKAQTEVARALVKMDPEMAIEFLVSLPHFEGGWTPEEPPPNIAAFIEWGKQDPEAAGARLLELPTDLQLRCVYGLIESWVVHDPAAAEAWIGGLTDAPLVSNAVQAYVTNLAPRDPATAAAFLRRNWNPRNTDEGSDLVRSIVEAWAEKDELAALAWVKSLPDEETRGEGLSTFMNSVSSRDPKHAADLWMAEYSTGNDLAGWFSGIDLARDIAFEAGFSAGAEFVAQVPEKVRKGVAKFFIQELMRGGDSLGPVETAEAVLREKADPFRAELLRSVFEELAFAGELAEAQRLGASLPPGPQRDAAVSGFLESQLSRDPDAALRFLSAVDPTPAGRELLLLSVAASSREAKSPVRSWLEETRLLSPAEKQRVLTLQKEPK